MHGIRNTVEYHVEIYQHENDPKHRKSRPDELPTVVKQRLMDLYKLCCCFLFDIFMYVCTSQNMRSSPRNIQNNK